MLKAMLSVLVLALSLSSVAKADDVSSGDTGKSTLKVDDVSNKKNKVDGDIDQEITNAKLRAESGSKSQWSLSLTPGYTGGTLTRAFAAERPDLSGEPGQQNTTSVDMGFNARFRWTKNDSLTLGSSVSALTPFQGHVDKKRDEFSLSDPSVGYDRVGKILGLQTVASVSYGYGTSVFSRSIDATHELGLSYNAMKSFQNGLSVGASVGFSYEAFSTKPGQSKNVKWRMDEYGGDQRSQYDLGIYPQAEYEINDKLSARTVFGYFNWAHLYGDQNHYRLLQTYLYQSIGIGYSVTRDVYLYPNIQFVPNHLQSNFTNVALSATINIF